MYINDLYKLICAKFDINTVNHLAHCLTPIPQGLLELELNDYLIEYSYNPLEQGVLWKELKAEEYSTVAKETELNSLLKLSLNRILSVLQTRAGKTMIKNRNFPHWSNCCSRS